LARRQDAEATQMLYRLTFSPAHEVRQAALEALSDVPPTRKIRQRVEALAESDDDPIVRGHARLMLADWKLAEKSPARGGNERPITSPTRTKGLGTRASRFSTTNSAVPTQPSVLKPTRPLGQTLSATLPLTSKKKPIRPVQGTPWPFLPTLPEAIAPASFE